MGNDRPASGENSNPDLPASYSRVAAEYQRQFFHEFDHKPFDRALLDEFIALVSPLGPACDVGCGPGHLARYLHERGLPACGIDIAPGMIDQARALNHGIEFHVADMRSTGLASQSLGGIAAFYSIIHIPTAELQRVFVEFHRLLHPGGLLLLAFHIGTETIHLDEWWNQPVRLDFYFYPPYQLSWRLETAGFTLLRINERPPYPFEHPSRRGYILARKPA